MVSKERIKEFEDTMKKYIAFRFQKYLPESSVVLLKNNNYLNDNDFKNNVEEGIIKSDIIRNMLYDTIDITCMLNVELDDGDVREILYGEHLENGLVEFLSIEVAKENGLDFKIDPDCKDDLQMVLEIYRVLGNKLEELAFKNNAIEILEAAGIDDITEYNDNLAIEEYINAPQLKHVGIDEKELQEKKKKEEELKNQAVGSKEETEAMNKEFAVDGVLQIIYVNGKRKVKYTDEYNVTHILNVDDEYALSDIYRREFAKTKNGEKIDSKKVYLELKDKFGEEALDDELDSRKISQDKIKTTEYVNQNSKFKQKTKDKKVLFNEDADIFILPGTNEVLEAHVKGEGIEATITGKEDEETSELGPDDINPVSATDSMVEGKMDQNDIDRVKENAENNSLSLDELRELKNALIAEAKIEGNEKEANRISEEMGIDELAKLNSEMQESGPKLRKKTAAYINKPLLFFILCMVISISLIIGAALAYLK